MAEPRFHKIIGAGVGRDCQAGHLVSGGSHNESVNHRCRFAKTVVVKAAAAYFSYHLPGRRGLSAHQGHFQHCCLAADPDFDKIKLAGKRGPEHRGLIIATVEFGVHIRCDVPAQQVVNIYFHLLAAVRDAEVKTALSEMRRADELAGI